MEKTICELFAGVGGFRLGFEKSSKDWKTVWFSQWEPGKTKQWAHDCYVSHFGTIDIDDAKTNVDIATVDKSKVPSHNLLVGGFPCQDYSVAHSLSTEKGIEGKKGVLWWQIRDLLEIKKAPFVLLENVDRLLKSPSKQRGRDFGMILACFASLDYSVEWRVINAAEYGAAQRRRRTFIFAYKNSTNFANTQKDFEIKDIFETSGFFAKSFPIEKINLETEENKTKTKKQKSDEKIVSISSIDLSTSIENNKKSYDLLKISDNFAFSFENTGFMKDGIIFTVKTEPSLENPILLKNILETNADKKFVVSNSNLEKWKYLKGAKKIERTSKTGFKYTFSEGPIAFPDNLNSPARTMLTSEGTLNRSSHIILDPISNNYRILTPKETERIQGFDDDWTNTGMPEKFRYFCMGNALVVSMVTRMANVLNSIFDKE